MTTDDTLQNKTTFHTPTMVSNSLNVNFTFVAINIIVVLLAYLVHFNRAEQQYYSASSNNKITPLQARYEPNVHPSSLLAWASQAATAAYTIDFVHYKENIDEIRTFFTNTGWDSFSTNLESGLLDDVITNKLSVTASLLGTPVIIQEGEKSGTYSWLIQVPILIHYTTSGQEEDKKTVISLKINKVPSTEAETGIGIVQFNDIGGLSE